MITNAEPINHILVFILSAAKHKLIIGNQGNSWYLFLNYKKYPYSKSTMLVLYFLEEI